MAIRSRGVQRPPSVEDRSMAAWMQSVTDALNGQPFSYFSTTAGPNGSGVTAPVGTLGIEIGDGPVKFWIKERSTSTGWSSLATS